MRLKEIAARVQHEFDGDLRSALVGPLERVRKTLKKFPNIADPGVDRILLFFGDCSHRCRAIELSARAGQDSSWSGA